jgi:5'-3' exonuclease
MGIPFLYREIIKKNPDVIIDKLPISTKRLFLDFNSIIHQCVNDLKNKCLNIDNHIFESIIECTNNLVNICKPTDLLYIAIDGVAPIAKQHQQRKRRYLSAYNNSYIENFKDLNNIKYIKWDSNQITPGTDFMIRLNKYLKDYYNNTKTNYKVIVSGSDEIGEGEHKFINYMKDNLLTQENDIDVIYGLDADLIMLSLTCGIKNIFLMRDDNNYVDINKLSKSISYYLYNSDDISYMYDYVVICFLVGNDFLPNISCLKLRFNALNLICETYKSIYKELQQNLILFAVENNYYKINYTFFHKFIESIAKNEDKLMNDITIEYNKTKFNYSNKEITTDLDKLMNEIDNYPLKNKMTHLINPVNDNKWKANYYEHLFGDHSESIIKSSSINFLEGINWNINYYINRDYSKYWYYKYNYAPSISDISKYLSIMGNNEFDKFIINTRNNKNDPVIEPIIQLLLVLPPQSIEILPDKYKVIMNNINFNCMHYYPISFNLSTYLKYFGWECIPILPEINIKHLIENYNNI